MKLLPLITEDHKHDFGAILLKFECPRINWIHSQIESKDIYDPDGTYGLEKETHVTLLFGLHKNVTDKQVEDALKDIKFGDVKLTGPTLFENDDFEVLKFDASGFFLHQANKELKKLPYKEDFPEYHPHMTISYLKPGTGKKYVDIIKKEIDKLVVKPKSVIYSKTDGSKKKLSTNLK